MPLMLNYTEIWYILNFWIFKLSLVFKTLKYNIVKVLTFGVRFILFIISLPIKNCFWREAIRMYHFSNIMHVNIYMGKVGTNYSKVDQVKFGYQKAVFYKIYLVLS